MHFLQLSKPTITLQKCRPSYPCDRNARRLIQRLNFRFYLAPKAPWLAESHRIHFVNGRWTLMPGHYRAGVPQVQFQLWQSQWRKGWWKRSWKPHAWLKTLELQNQRIQILILRSCRHRFALNSDSHCVDLALQDSRHSSNQVSLVRLFFVIMLRFLRPWQVGDGSFFGCNIQGTPNDPFLSWIVSGMQWSNKISVCGLFSDCVSDLNDSYISFPHQIPGLVRSEKGAMLQLSTVRFQDFQLQGETPLHQNLEFKLGLLDLPGPVLLRGIVCS